jgi:predicted nucleotidyltransferase
MRPTTSVSPSDLALAKEFVRRLAQEVDPRLFTVTLFGSRARGEADEESDLDLFVALKENDPQGEAKEAASRIACDLTLESGILVSLFVANKEFLRQHEGFSFLQAVEEEGVPL